MSDRLDLTREEQDHVRAALHFLRTRTGGWGTLAAALGFTERTLVNVGQGRNVSERLVIRLARFAKVSVDALLAGEVPAPGTCPYCGHVRAAEKEEVAETGGS